MPKFEYVIAINKTKWDGTAYCDQEEELLDGEAVHGYKTLVDALCGLENLAMHTRDAGYHYPLETLPVEILRREVKPWRCTRKYKSLSDIAKKLETQPRLK